MVEKSHRRQMMAEIKKKQNLRKELQTAQEKVAELERQVKV